MASNRSLGCLIANFRPEGKFKFTAQQVADNHDVLTNVVYPINPEVKDLHLVDFEGDAASRSMIEYRGNTNIANSNINIDINQVSHPNTGIFYSHPNVGGPYDTNINGNLTINVSNMSGYSAANPILISNTEISGKLKFTGNYDGPVGLSYGAEYSGSTTINIYLEGNYNVPLNGIVIIDTKDNMTYNFYINNAKFITANTALTLVGLSAPATGSVVNLICTNVKTNTLTALDARVNLIGDLTQNVNFK